MADEPPAARVRRPRDRPARLRRRDAPGGVPGVAREVLARPAARRGGLALVLGADPLPAAATSPNPADYDELVTTLEAIDKEQNSRAATTSTTSRPSRRRSPRSSPSSAGSASTTSVTRAAGGGSSSRSRSATTSNSAIRLNREVGKVFRESQVYRIDHYLGKETVRNLLVFRFGNGIFEPIWNRRHIDHVQITVAESIGVENRGAFYEETGASRDFLQNHLLQLMSLVAMEPPATFDADALRDEKVKVIRAIGELTPDQIRTDVVRGQYGPGWVAGQAGPGLPRRSRRSTRSRRPRRTSPPGSRSTTGAGRACPFYLRTGKRLPKRATEIAIQFKEVPHRLFREFEHRARPEPARDPDPAGRGDHAAVRGQGARASGSTSGR